MGVVAAHLRPGKGSEHAQLLQPAHQSGGSQSVADVGMKDQRPWPAPAGTFPQAGADDEISDDLLHLPHGHVSGQHLATKYVDHQTEVEPDATDTAGRREIPIHRRDASC